MNNKYINMTTFIQFFKNIKPVPRCIDCKYYLIEKLNSSDNMYNSAKCLNTVVYSKDTESFKFEYAYIARSDNKMCGSNGNKFVSIRKGDK